MNAQEALVIFEKPWLCRVKNCGERFKFQYQMFRHRDEAHRY